MKTPKANLALKEQPVEEVEGFVPIPFPETPALAAGAQYEMTAGMHIALKGPYLFRFVDPEGLRVSSLRCGNYALDGNDTPFDAQALIASTDSFSIGDQFFPIDGPTLEVGQAFRVTVFNGSGRPRKVSLVVYAKRANRNA